MKRIAAVLTLAGAIFGVVAPTAASAAGPQACITAHVVVNGTPVVDQPTTCLPQ
jgi:uncharacterized membrane protein YjfL (UPF0719 family)